MEMRGIALCGDGVRNCRVTAWEAWERPVVSEKLMVHGCILLLRLDMVKRAAKRCRRVAASVCVREMRKYEPRTKRNGTR